MNTATMHPIIILGAGLAGWTTARELRKLDTTTPVVVITADSGDFYAKPSLSNAFAQKRGPDQLISTPAAKMVETLNVTLQPHCRVSTLDLAAKTVAFKDSTGDTQTLAYSQLVLATGAQPIRVPVQGDAADRVRSVNSLDDFRALHADLAQPLGMGSAELAASAGAAAAGDVAAKRTIVIMGAGLIGCEFANDLLTAGHHVHVVDPAERPLQALLPALAGDQLRDALGALGLEWHFGKTVQSVTCPTSGTSVTSSEDPSALGAAGGPWGRLVVRLSSGQTISAHLVLSAVGLRADTTLATAAGLQCERGIVVNELLQTSSPYIFALGDCAQYGGPGGRTLPYVMPIMNAARALAQTLNGTPTSLAFPLMPVSVKTPALPIVVAPPAPGQEGTWDLEEGDTAGTWRFASSDGQQRGFVLTGKHTARRMELSKLTLP